MSLPVDLFQSKGREYISAVLYSSNHTRELLAFSEDAGSSLALITNAFVVGGAFELVAFITSLQEESKNKGKRYKLPLSFIA